MTRAALQLALALAAAAAQPAFAQDPRSPQREDDPKLYPLIQVGEIQPRTTLMQRPQGDRGFSIGLETIERDFVSYPAVEPYLVPLGFTQGRLMAGWSNIETIKGQYDFSEILFIVRDLRSKGIRPWVGLTYGNPAVYGEAGGGATLGGGLPMSPEARAAWLRFVSEIVRVLGPEGVAEWEIWNEPNWKMPASTYAPFAVETASAILRVQPKAVLTIGALLVPTVNDERGMPFTQELLATFKKGVKIAPDKVKVSYHPYTETPESWYDARFDAFRSLVESYGYRLRQGENGAPSANQQVLALRNAEWTEDGQAKYALRRLLSDFARNIETGYFSLSEIHYPRASGDERFVKNQKGVLQTGKYSGLAPNFGDKNVVRAKSGYRALQNFASVFDDSISVDEAAGCIALEGYQIIPFIRAGATPLRGLAVWRSADRPGDMAKAMAIDIACSNFALNTDALELSNLLTGSVYRVNVPHAGARRDGAKFTWTGLGVTDSPALIADRGFVRHE